MLSRLKKHIFPLLLLLLVVSGCRKESEKSDAALSKPPDFPPAVIRMAKAYAVSSTNHETANIQREFCRSFFDGFTHPGASLTSSNDSARSGFLAGQEYFRTNEVKTKEIMEGFGYVTAEAKGTLTLGFERNGFYPSKHPGQTWWLWSFTSAHSNPTRQNNFKDGDRVSIVGYISGKGKFGHLNDYDHEFFVTSITKD